MIPKTFMRGMTRCGKCNMSSTAGQVIECKAGTRSVSSASHDFVILSHTYNNSGRTRSRRFEN